MRPERRLSLPEFVALMALLFATVAFSIDAMLPGFPQIAAELTPAAVNRVQLMVTAFMLGLGVGTLFAGPLSDSFGRKAVVTAGLAIYMAGALLAWLAQSLELVLAARMIQGLGAAGPRVAPMAMVRDLHAGRKMAQILSFITTVFMLVPALAPLAGAAIIGQWGWRAIFAAFAVFALVGGLWLNLRQPETLPRERRRPFRPAPIRAAVAEIVANSHVRRHTLVLTLGFAVLVALLSSTQQIYDITFGRGESFAWWFALTAVLASTGTMLNAALVVRLGMRRLTRAAFAFQTLFTLAFLALLLSGMLPGSAAFPAWFLWSLSIFFLAGLSFGNLTALALQPMGHVAGTAASVVSAVSTILAVFIAVPIGLSFDGTPVPLLAGAFICAGLGWLLMRGSHEYEAAEVDPR